MAMFLKPTIDCIFLDKVFVMIFASSSNTKLARIVSGMPRPSEATTWVAKSIVDCMARWRLRTKMSWASGSSRRSGSSPVTSFILLRHFCIAATFARTTSLSGINPSFQDVFLTRFSYLFKIIVLVDRICEKLMEMLLVTRVKQSPMLEYLHFQNRRGVV